MLNIYHCIVIEIVILEVLKMIKKKINLEKESDKKQR